MNAIATTWGISSALFLEVYVGLCVIAAIAAVLARRDPPGDRIGRNDPLPELGPYKLAMLSGGPQLAITAGDPLADGVAFARFAGRAALSDDVGAELLLGRAGLRRRGPWVRAACLRRPYRRLLVVARLPPAGRVWRSFPSRPRGW